jgi:glucokinase
MAAANELKLLADIGNRYARFAIERETGKLENIQALLCDDHADLLAAIRSYLRSVDGTFRHGAIAIANPVAGDLVRMTNYHWRFSIEATREALGFDTLLVVNDFTALAMSLPHLSASEKRQVGGGRARERNVVGLVGPGTGLGVSGLIPVDDGGWVSLGSEGGHVAFAPRTPREEFILEYALRQFAHVSAERIVSASGLELVYQALAERNGRQEAALDAPEIGRRAVAGESDLCSEAIEVFCEILGTVAADLALTLGAQGGIYIGGGIVPRLGTLFEKSGFRARFESKGRLSAYVASIPTFVVSSQSSTLAGAAAILNAQLQRRAGVSSLLDRVRQGRDELSMAERRVADLVLAQPRSMLNDPIVTIAARAGVSQPTVVRFCRSLGYEGLSDFKLKLASGLTGTIPVTHTQVTRADSTLVLGAKVLDNTVSAVLQVREQLNSEAVERAIDRLLAARRIELYGVGNYGTVAQDAQYKFLRLGIPTVAYTDTRLQSMAAAVLTPADVVVVISGSGKLNELLKAVETAIEAGAPVIAITPSHSPLARRATVAIAIDHPEDVATHIPMISRILYLIVIDVLAVGVAMRRSTAPALREPGETAELRGIEGSRLPDTDFTRIISHSG